MGRELELSGAVRLNLASEREQLSFQVAPLALFHATMKEQRPIACRPGVSVLSKEGACGEFTNLAATVHGNRLFHRI